MSSAGHRKLTRNILTDFVMATPSSRNLSNRKSDFAAELTLLPTFTGTLSETA